MFTNQLREIFKGISDKLGKILGSYFSANGLTWISLILGLGGAYSIYLDFFGVAIILILVSGIADFLNGAVAKAKNQETRVGALFDSVADRITELSWYIVLGFYNPQLWLPVSLAIAAIMLSSYVSQHATAVGLNDGGGIIERTEKLFAIILILIFISYAQWVLYALAGLSLITAGQRFFRAEQTFFGKKV